jgi:hypothetical protein
MVLSDVLSVGAIVVSILTFVVTLYEQYLKAAKLRLVVGGQLWVSYGHGRKHLGFWASVALSNLGAVDAVVLDITGTLVGTDGWEAVVHWYSFGDFAAPRDGGGGGPDDGEGEDGGEPQFIAKGWTETLVAGARGATTNWIGFHLPALPGPLRPDLLYTLTLMVKVPVQGVSLLGLFHTRDAGQRTAARWTGRFTLSAKQIADLQDYGEADTAHRVGRLLLVEVTGAAQWFQRQSATAELPGAKQLDRVGADWRPPGASLPALPQTTPQQVPSQATQPTPQQQAPPQEAPQPTLSQAPPATSQAPQPTPSQEAPPENAPPRAD